MTNFKQSKTLFSLFLFLLVFPEKTMAAVCDDTYYAAQSVMVTLTGPNLQSLTVFSVDSITQNYNDLPALPGVNYRIPTEFTSSCNAYAQQLLRYVQRDAGESFFGLQEDSVNTVLSENTQLGDMPIQDWFFIQNGPTAGLEYISYTDSVISAFYATARLTDTLKSSLGSVLSIRSRTLNWWPDRDSSRYLDSLRVDSLWNEPPPTGDTLSFRAYTVQLYTVLYDTNITMPDTSVPKTMALAAPAGGETWMHDSTYTISWNFTGAIYDVRLEYHDGNQWVSIADSIPNTGSFNWTVPEPVSDSSQIKVSSLDSSVSDLSPTFLIVGKSLNLLTPSPGEQLTQDSTYAITWGGEGIIDTVVIELYWDSTWIPLDTIPNTGSLDWTIPDTLIGSLLLRVSELGGTASHELSGTVEIISPVVAVPFSSEAIQSIFGISGHAHLRWNTGLYETVHLLNSRGQRLRSYPVVPGLIVWDGSDYAGRPVPRGILYIQFESGRSFSVYPFYFNPSR